MVKRALPFLVLILAGCGGGTDHWNYHWASANGNVTIDASGENLEKLDVFHHAQQDPAYPNVW